MFYGDIRYLVYTFIGMAIIAVAFGIWVFAPMRGINEIRIDDGSRNDVADAGDTSGSVDRNRHEQPAIMRRQPERGFKLYRADEFPLQHPKSANHGPDLGGE